MFRWGETRNQRDSATGHRVGRGGAEDESRGGNNEGETI